MAAFKQQIRFAHSADGTRLAYALVGGKTKELIGLAIASQTPCQHCVYFHTEAAKLNGATDREIGEAVAMAALTRHWSTVLNGAQIDEAAFRKEVEQIVANARKALAKR